MVHILGALLGGGGREWEDFKSPFHILAAKILPFSYEEKCFMKLIPRLIIYPTHKLPLNELTNMPWKVLLGLSGIYEEGCGLMALLTRIRQVPEGFQRKKNKFLNIHQIHLHMMFIFHFGRKDIMEFGQYLLVNIRRNCKGR